MTREEAVRELKADYCGNRIICELYPDQCNREDCEIWLAIKAMAEQPIRVLETQPDGDVISRQEALNIVYEIDTFQAGWRTYAMDQIKALPSVQPEVDKDTNVPINDTILRQSAIDAVNNIMQTKEGFLEPSEVLCELMQLPSAQPEPCEDVVSRKYLTEHIEACWMNGRMMKPDLNEVLSWIDDIPSAQPEETCDTCKHGYFGDGKCDYCRERYPSHYERRTDD